MRKLSEEANRICRSKELKEVYANFENAYDIDYLSAVLCIKVLAVSEYLRQIARQVQSMNKAGENVYMAAFPSICGQIYIIINESDLDKAHKLGLEIRYI